jgi:hypothetical protein
MSSKDLDTALLLLTGLSKAELKTVRARIDLLVGSNSDAVFSGDEAFVSSIIRDTWPSWPSDFVISRGKRHKSFSVGVQQFVKYVDSQFSPMSPVQRLGLLRLLITHVIEGVCARGFPLSVVNVGFALGEVGVVVEDCYPGYSVSGLLREVLLHKGEKFDGWL